MNGVIKWLGIISVVGIELSCGLDSQSKLNQSANEMRNCADEQILTPSEQQAIRQKINANQKAQQIEEIIQQKVRGGLNGNVLIAQKGIILYKHCFGLGHFESSTNVSR